MKVKKIEVDKGYMVSHTLRPYMAHGVYIGDVQIGMYTVTEIRGSHSIHINDSITGLDAPKKHIPAVYEHNFISWISHVSSLYKADNWADIEHAITQSFESLLIFFE